MKSLPNLALALALALTGASSASAATTVYHVAGASSFRVALITTEVNYLASITTGTVSGAYAGTSGLTGNNVTLVEAPVSGGTIVFENNLSGGIAGTENVSGLGNKIAFPTPTGLTLNPVNVGNSTTPATGGTANVTFTTESTFADIAFSDNTLATASKIIKLATSSTVSANSGGTVGVVVYDFIANATSDVTDFGSTTVSSTGTVTTANATVALSITPQNFSNLWGSGSVEGSTFTGNPADTGVTVYATGRDIDSGARATALAETGYGLKGSGAIAVTGALQQVYPLDSSNNIVGTASTNVIESFEQVPASTVDGISLNAGNGGYNSSSNLGKALSVTIDPSSNPQTVLIGYLAATDAYAALTASGTNRHSAILLGYAGSTFNPGGSTTANGFATQADINKVYYGQYTFWGYEQVFYNSNNVSTNLQDSANPSSVVSSLVTQLKTNGLDVLSSAGVSLGGLQVARSDDGLQVD
jgi:hypothetical protein